MGVNTDYGTIESGGQRGLYDAVEPELLPGFDSQIAPACDGVFLGNSTGDSNDYFARTGYDYGAAIRANVLANRAPSPDDLTQVPGINRVSHEFKEKVIEKLFLPTTDNLY